LCSAAEVPSYSEIHDSSPFVAPPQVAAPYVAFSKAGFEVDVASILGGEPPVDAGSLGDMAKSDECVAFAADAGAAAKLAATQPVDAFVATAASYAAVFLPGGHGTALDFRGSDGLKKVIENAYAAGGVIGAVCHGPCGLLSAEIDGKPLVAGKKVTGFSNVEEQMVGLEGKVPYSLEDALVQLGGTYAKGDPWGPFVQVDGRLVTGQNPGSSKLCGDKIVELLSA
jgi:putative intracellular protease/amidase